MVIQGKPYGFMLRVDCAMSHLKDDPADARDLLNGYASP